MGAGGLVRAEWLHELLLELKAQLGLRGWGAATWPFPGGVILPWSIHPCHVTLQLVPLTGLIAAAGEPIRGCGSPLWQQCSGVVEWELGKMGKSNTCTVLWP